MVYLKCSWLIFDRLSLIYWTPCAANPKSAQGEPNYYFFRVELFLKGRNMAGPAEIQHLQYKLRHAYSEVHPFMFNEATLRKIYMGLGLGESKMWP